MRPRQKCQSRGMDSLQITEQDQVKEDGQYRHRVAPNRLCMMKAKHQKHVYIKEKRPPAIPAVGVGNITEAISNPFYTDIDQHPFCNVNRSLPFDFWKTSQVEKSSQRINAKGVQHHNAGIIDQLIRFQTPHIKFFVRKKFVKIWKLPYDSRGVERQFLSHILQGGIPVDCCAPSDHAGIVC